MRREDRVSPKDIRLEVKVRNNLILRKMESKGFATVAELSRACGISQSEIGRLVNMRFTPMRENGEWMPIVEKLAAFLECVPEELFSEMQRTTALPKNKATAEIDFAETQAFLTREKAEALLPDLLAMTGELAKHLREAIVTLPPQLQQVLTLRFGLGDEEELTLEQVGEKLNLTREEVRQMEAKALRWMRHPSRSERLRNHLDEYNY